MSHITTAFKLLLLTLVSVLMVIPIYFTFSVSASSKARINEGAIIPDFDFTNWVEVTGGFGYWRAGIINSIIISFFAMVLALAVSIPAGYVFTRFRFLADKHLFFWLLTNRMAPPVVFAIPYLMIWRGIGLWDTHAGLIIAYMVFEIPITTWIISSFLASVPREIDEAAFIDGYSVGRLFRKIILPLLRPAIGVAMFFAWLFAWTEMFFASVLSSVVSKTLPAQLLTALGKVGWGVEYGPAAAAGFVTLIPGLVLLYWVRKYAVRGFVLGRL
ncbi:MAG: carbohydrate ABC transporter permease [Candidatus Caldarchaeum sp.]|nr:carbohydrate ABC transporter permease [Candidatus Caldarchaeum sp.]